MKHRGTLLTIFGLVFLAQFACPARAQAIDPILIYADNGSWSSELVVTATEPTDATISNCLVGPLPRVVLQTGQTKRVASLGALQCGPTIGYVSSDIHGAVTDLTFNDGVTYSHFSVPALSRFLTYGDTAGIPRVVNGADLKTFLVLVNTGATTVVTVTVFGENGERVGTEVVTLLKGVNFRPLETAVGAGRLEIKHGVLLGTPATSNGLVFGFAAIGPASGASQRIEVLQ